MDLSSIDFCEEGALPEDMWTCVIMLDISESLLLDHIDELPDASIQAPFLVSLTTSKSPTKRKRYIRKTSSTVIQRRKKTEIKTLQEEVAQLEGYIAQIKRTGGQRNHFAAIENGDGHSTWRHEALAQYQERHRSEQTNRRHKKILEQQW
ncbi:unnamed protein product [Phytophthora lilii]|uniref:Unnamed protein product n=1 Tax=Phytophthora lilii TaxID=2077276 RepID=A0A9W6TNM0_9STRA|nr:unnamed protein product [Phytophthora lilii]